MSVVEGVLDVVGAAVAAAESDRAAAAREETRAAEALRHQYREILVRANNPKPGDERRLADLIGELGLSVADVRKDAKTVADAERAIALVNERAARDAAHRAAREARDELVAKHREALAVADQRVNEAASEARKCGWAFRDCQRLFHDAPEFFVGGLLTLPDAVLQSVQPSPAVKAERVEPQVKRWINSKWWEPVLGADGRYLRDSLGEFIFPVKPAPEPLLDERGRHRTDQHGRLMYQTPADEAKPEDNAAPELEAVETQD